MQLLDEEKLKWSSVVANCNMNRERNLSGINSYEKDIYFNVVSYLKSLLRKGKNVAWADLCCGSGKAVIQSNKLFKAQKIALEGIDLVDMFDALENSDTNLKFVVVSLLDWQPQKQYDLVTCVHGLHYIGDKLAVIEKIVSSLKDHGKFIGNIDLDNVKNSFGKSLKKVLLKQFKAFEITYDSRRHLLVCEGKRDIKFPLKYLGANDKAGTNYTGQEVVDSVYEIEG